MKFRDTLLASTLGLTVTLIPVPSEAKSIKLPPSVTKKVGDIFRSKPSVPSRTGAILGADKATRLAHGIYATMTVAQIAALNEKSMDDMALQYYLVEKSKAAETGRLLTPEQDETAHRVQQITRRILHVIKQHPEFQNRYQEIKTDITGGTGWKIMTVENPTLNAYCLPGGRMVVYSGLAKMLSDDELAIVIGHEIMHAMEGHSFEQAKSSLQRKALIFAWATVVGVKSLPISIAVLGEMFVTGTVFSRSNEKEADIMGIHIARDAGYDPRAAISLWRKMDQTQSGRQPPEFLSSHSSHGSRERYLEEEIRNMGF